MKAESAVDQEIGYFRVFARPPGGDRVEITMFRGVPVTVSGIQTADPFTDISLNLELPQVTVFDAPGTGDLWWLRDYSDVDVVWENTGAYNFDWQFEGFMVSENLSLNGSGSSCSVECKGSALLLDNYMASPQFPSQPIPYELLIKDAFDQSKHPARLARLKLLFPDGWDTVVPTFDDPAFLGFLKPWGVSAGDLWTGLTARTTGSWDPVLTGFVQGLLSVMYDAGGAQWTIAMEKGRKPVLRLRTIPAKDDPEVLVVDLLNPGVELSASRDSTQSANVIFGEGSDTAGVSFSGMEVSPNGRSTRFIPFAYSQHVYPASGNPGYNPDVTRKEVHIKFPSGMDELAARNVARAQLQRFADPGITGTLTLATDLQRTDGSLFPAKLVKAGRSVLIKGFRGRDVLAHVTQSTVDMERGQVSLTIDTKYRDQLTVAEVQARTRDALTPLRSLQVGKYSNTVQDLLYPWSYAEGSGIFPNSDDLSARDFFQKKLPADAVFPYEEWTQKYPPSNPAYRKYYVRVDPVNRADATLNWAGETITVDQQSPTSMYRELFNADSPGAATVDRSVRVFFAALEPLSAQPNDVWVKTGDGYKRFKFLGYPPGNQAPTQAWKRLNNSTFEILMGFLPPTLNNETITMSLAQTAPDSPQQYDIWINRPEGNVNVRAGDNTWTSHRMPKPATLDKPAVPVRLSASGAIRLTQFAAYDADGAVKQVRFHVSVYANPGTSTSSMPYIVANQDGSLPPYLHPPGGDNYKEGQRTPFFRSAFESVDPNGTTTELGSALDGGAGLIVGWGNYYEAAGYWPGRFSKGAARTGLLVDETAWSYDLTSQLSPDDRHDNLRNPDAGLASVMIYCDDSETPTYFMGRMFRQEPGAS